MRSGIDGVRAWWQGRRRCRARLVGPFDLVHERCELRGAHVRHRYPADDWLPEWRVPADRDAVTTSVSGRQS